MPDMRNKQQDGAMAYLFLRAILGINIFIHGASRILIGVSSFADGMVGMFKQTPLPAGLVHLFGLALPWAEAVVGLLLLLGLLTRGALIAGSLLMISLTFGVALRQDWPTAGLQLIYAIIYAALLAFRDYNILSIDALMRRKP